ncbi:MAG TPA: M48 family metalloprotease [Flavitalea sp.]|nr:M48 family metalloprotease [Flavitalea sp.]
MSTHSMAYPPSPANIPDAVKRLSADFRREVRRVLTSIILFFVVYLLLILLAAILAALTVYGGAALILAAPKFFTLMIGLGLIGLGVMVLFFLIKFVFAVSRFDHSTSIEIFEEQQPELFQFIRKLSQDTQTSFPKKIYLSPEVNACVFYNSNFWSMFFPVRKNLQIGLGLVNVLTISELKAVIAHEFGHFSQKSMKLGSFVYNVNKVIYNMLYHNNGYGNTLNAWANIHTLFAFFATLTVRIVQGIQWILQRMYSFMNKNYMALSRQMEFHADAVAASVSGSDSLVDALRRLDLADACYHSVLRKYDDLFKQKLVANNLYQDHQTVMQHIAKEHRLEIRNNVAIVNDEFLQAQVQNRVNYRDQWASHPSVEERTRALMALNVSAEHNNESAWLLFNNREMLQQQLTKKVYGDMSIPEEAVEVNPESFYSKYLADQEIYKLPQVFNGYFDERELSEVHINRLFVNNNLFNTDLNAWKRLSSDENIRLPRKIGGLKSDIRLLDNIISKYIIVKTFDFDGEKFNKNEAPAIKEKLTLELRQAEEKQIDLDEEFILFFYRLSRMKSDTGGENYLQQYSQYTKLQKDTNSFLKDVNDSLELIAPFYSDESLTVGAVDSIVIELKTVKEPAFKNALRYWLQECDFSGYSTLHEKALQFLESDYLYFTENTFMNNELEEYNYLLREMWMVVSLHKFKTFKQFLNQQALLLPEEITKIVNNQARA